MDGESEQTAVAGYQAVHLVAHSYLGSLWLALDQRTGARGKPVLLRRVQLSEQTRSEAFQRMACAGRDAMALSHENVLPVVDVVLQPDSLALVYEYVEAEPLRALQSWATHRRLAFPVGVSLRLSLDLLRGVRALHGTLLGWPSAPPFGGLSPDSILVSRDGRTRLCDPLVSSCATMLEGMNLNVAKLAYTAPEQAYATAPLGAASDIFTCGVLLWELLAGNRLFTGPRATVERKLLEHDLPHLRGQLPSGVELSDRLLALVERCLTSDAGLRPQSPAELVGELEQCGHPVASLEQVGAFVAELAGSRFEQRRMTVRSLPSLRAPAVKPSGTLATRQGSSAPHAAEASRALRCPVSSLQLGTSVAPAPSRASLPRVPLPDRHTLARVALSKAPQRAPNTPRPAEPRAPEPRVPAAVPRATPRARVDSVVVVPPSEPLLDPPEEVLVIAPAAEPVLPRPSSVPPLLVPAGTTTMIGLALPPSLLQASAQFEKALRRPSPIPSGTLQVSSDPALHPSTTPPGEPPLPIRSLIPTLRPRPASEAPLETPPPSSRAAGSRRPSGWSQAPGAASARPLQRAVWASLLATLTLAGALGTALLLRPSHGLGSAAAGWSGASQGSSESPRAALEPSQPTRIDDPTERDAGRGVDGGFPFGNPTPLPAAALAATPSWNTAELGDDQLRVLFGLERRVQLPDCGERLGASMRSHDGTSPRKSQAQLRAARRQLLRGNNTEAQRLLCSATAHFAGNVAAWQALAELTLQLGDAARAKLELEQALKHRPNDGTLLGLLGDAQAVLGDLTQSRALWAKSLRVSAIDRASTQGLARKFASIGARKLRDWKYGPALLQYRRAVVLSLGAPGPSAGMGEALRRLGQPQAALAWVDRAASRAPR